MITQESHIITIPFSNGKEIRLLSDAQKIVLQIRHLPPTGDDLITSSTQEHVQLSATAATALASDLLRVATPLLEQQAGNDSAAKAPQPAWNELG